MNNEGRAEGQTSAAASGLESVGLSGSIELQTAVDLRDRPRSRAACKLEGPLGGPDRAGEIAVLRVGGRQPIESDRIRPAWKGKALLGERDRFGPVSQGIVVRRREQPRQVERGSQRRFLQFDRGSQDLGRLGLLVLVEQHAAEVTHVVGVLGLDPAGGSKMRFRFRQISALHVDNCELDMRIGKRLTAEHFLVLMSCLLHLSRLEQQIGQEQPRGDEVGFRFDRRHVLADRLGKPTLPGETAGQVEASFGVRRILIDNRLKVRRGIREAALPGKLQAFLELLHRASSDGWKLPAARVGKALGE